MGAAEVRLGRSALEAAGAATESPGALVLGGGLFLVAGDLLATGMELFGALEVAEHPSGALSQHQGVGVKRVALEHAIRMSSRLVRTASVEQDAS